MSARERSWPVPVALIALSAIPLTAGTLRLIQLAAGPAVIPSDHQFGTIFGTGVLAADLAKGAGWASNLAIAESAIRRPAHHRPALPTSPQQAGALS